VQAFASERQADHAGKAGELPRLNTRQNPFGPGAETAMDMEDCIRLGVGATAIQVQPHRPVSQRCREQKRLDNCFFL
jgi:hypothetical protein